MKNVEQAVIELIRIQPLLSMQVREELMKQGYNFTMKMVLLLFMQTQVLAKAGFIKMFAMVIIMILPFKHGKKKSKKLKNHLMVKV